MSDFLKACYWGKAMDERIYRKSYLEKSVYILGPYARLRGWFSRIKCKWDDAGIIERFMWLVKILYPFKDFLIWWWRVPATDIIQRLTSFCTYCGLTKL
jgi:hypothetical protein